jgi:sarcosine oxidase
MTTHCEVAVVGLGIMGSAAAHALALKGYSVIGFERCWAGHDRGSSNGHTRLIRQAHFEHPDYVPLVRRSYELWKALEDHCNRRLLVRTGSVVIGRESDLMVRGTRGSASEYGIAHEVLGIRELRAKFRWLRLQAKDVGVWEPDAGILLAEDCVTSFQEAAVRAGAQLRFGADCLLEDDAFADTSSAVRLEVNGEPIVAEHVVVAAGPWMSKIMPRHSIPRLDVERIVTYWVTPKPAFAASFDWHKFPVVLWDHPAKPFCIFPDIGGRGVKIAFHHNGVYIDPDEIDRTVKTDEIASVRAHLDAAAPLLNGDVAATRACMYTNTRDGHFAVGAIHNSRVIAVSACSGHGFKFAPVVAEVVAELIDEGATRHPTELFRLDRPTLHAVSEAVPAEGKVAGEESASSEPAAGSKGG